MPSFEAILWPRVANEHEEQSRIRSRSMWQKSVDYFRSNECKPPVILQMQVPLWVRNTVSQQSQYDLPQVAYIYWRSTWCYIRVV